MSPLDGVTKGQGRVRFAAEVALDASSTSGIVFGPGLALMEDTQFGERTCRIPNRRLAED
jgi:hypothetical protein